MPALYAFSCSSLGYVPASSHWFGRACRRNGNSRNQTQSAAAAGQCVGSTQSPMFTLQRCCSELSSISRACVPDLVAEWRDLLVHEGSHLGAEGPVRIVVVRALEGVVPCQHSGNSSNMWCDDQEPRTCATCMPPGVAAEVSPRDESVPTSLTVRLGEGHVGTESLLAAAAAC